MSFLSGKLILAAALLLPSVLWAQTFPVRLERTGSNGVCDNMTANRMAVDPASGRVTLQGVTGMTCLPDGAAGLGNVSISVPSGPHASGVTGLLATVQNIPAGASCTLRGVSNIQGNGLVGGQGWADGTSICTSCPTTVTRAIDLINVDTLSNWVFQLNVQCSIQSGGYAVQAPIVSSPPPPNAVTVLPAVVAQGSCPFGENVPTTNHNNLSIANRQTTTQVSNGMNGSGLYPATDWTSIFGATTGSTFVSPRTLPIPGPVGLGFGFPGPFIGQTYFRLERDKFIALKFRTPAADSNPSSNPLWTGIYTDLRTYTAATPTSALTFAVAPCPGQFREVPGAPLPPACVVQEPNGFKGSLGFILVDPAIPYTGNLCPLELGKTYYWNIMASDIRGSLLNSLCGSASCNYRMSKNPLFINGSYP